jgi:RHS repeat-associated protein
MTLPNGISTAYSYDAAGRLTGMKYSKGSQVLRDLTYGYDEINRRTSYSGNTAPAPRDTATDDATVNALNQYTTRNGKSVSHDDNANQTINNAVWDARDRLVSLSGPNFTASFTYDAMGRRTSKKVNGQTKTYLYDGSDLISETGADYTFGPGIDQPLERKSGQNEYYLSDALGSVIGLADGTGVIKTSYNYSPFGKKQTTGVTSSNPFAFTGREDDGTGYYYYRARYYSPDQKRFIAEDPLGFGAGDSNLQAYVGNNPVNATDPSGLITFVIPGIDNRSESLPNNLRNYGGNGGGKAKYPVVEIEKSGGLLERGNPYGIRDNAIAEADSALSTFKFKPGSGEPINIIAHSNGNNAVIGLVQHLREKYGSKVGINVVRLDAPGISRPSSDACRTLDIGSNHPGGSLVDIRSAAWGKMEADYQVPTDHMGLLNDNRVFNLIKQFLGKGAI